MAKGGPSQLTDLPHAVEAEQALLGAAMFDNGALDLVPGALEPSHFYDPVHQRLFARMRLMRQRGQLVEPFGVAAALASDPGFQELGAASYLVELLDMAPPAANAPDFARVILEVGTRRRLVYLGREIAERAMDGSEEAGQLLAELTAETGAMQAVTQGVTLIGADEAVDGVLDYVDNPGNHATGFTTGLEPLDSRLGPWIPGDLVAMAGRPGAGKSAEAAIIDLNVAEQNLGVVEIHAEMTVQQAWRRRLTAKAYQLFGEQAPSYASIRRRTITFEQRQMLEKAREALRGLPLVSVKRTGITLSQLWSLVARQRAIFEKAGIPLVLLTIDHAGLITSGRDYRSRVDEQTAVSNGLKAGADHHKVAVNALLQLNRSVESREDKRPQLQDLRDSGSWEQDCDTVIGVYRDAYYAAKEKEPDSSGTKGGLAWADWKARRDSPWIENILLKVREGETNTAKLWAHMPTNTILGAAPQDDSFFGGSL